MKRSEALTVANGALGVIFMYSHANREEREELLAVSRVLTEMIAEEENREKTK